MSEKHCGTCAYYLAEIEPDGTRNGMGFCASLATKEAGGEFERPVGMVAAISPSCSQFVPKRDDTAVDHLLASPQMPNGIEIERAIEVQAGRCHRRQDTMIAGSKHERGPLSGDQQRMCLLQVRGAIGNPQFHGRVVLYFRDRSLVAWIVRQYPKGGEIKT